jgi:23S rRNA (uracil1939-C5)-methyltransferase
VGLSAGAVVTLDVERPVAGGRMLARHEGQVVLVAGAIPGERVRARVERASRSVAHADTLDVVSPSADRRGCGDWRCGGRDYAHIAYERQQALKAEVIADAFRRIGRLPLAVPPVVLGSPEHGYRLRARLHAAGGSVGFLREGSHQLCDAVATRQLSEGTAAWLAALTTALPPRAAGVLVGVEIAENVPGSERAVHLECRDRIDPRVFASLAQGLTGLSVGMSDRPDVEVVAGTPSVADRLAVSAEPGAPTLVLARNVRAFFQANRFLLEPLVQHVVTRLPGGRLVDLYAGVGLFGLAAVAAGHDAVTLVEGDRTSGADLEANAQPFGARVRILRQSVEAACGRLGDADACIVDPPRTGLSPAARDGVLRLAARRVIYVSCDVATLARDARALVDAGYALTEVTGVDLFPTTAHIETVAVFERGGLAG